MFSIALKDVSLFKDLSPEQVRNFEENVQIYHFAPEDLLLNQGETSGRIFIVHSGLVRILQPNSPASDRGLLLALEGPGALLGEISYLHGIAHTANVDALLPTVCWGIGHNDFHNFVLAHPILALNLARLSSERLRRRSSQFETLILRDPEASIANVLLSLAKVAGVRDDEGKISLPVRFTQSNWAKMTGTARGTAIKHLENLQRRNIFHEVGRDGIVINDLEALKAACHGKKLKSVKKRVP